MAFNANEFKKAFNNKDTNTITASPAYFEAYFEAPPRCLLRTDIKASTSATIERCLRGMKFRASAADLPARQLVSIQRAFNGPHKLVPYSTIYSTSIVEFIETADFDIRTFFDAWQDMIEGNQRNYTSEYYDELIAPTFIVKAFNKQGAPVQQWTFYNVFPVSVNPSQLNWSQQSAIITVAVELSYHRWKFKSLPETL
jgi:hypothetical protein